MHAYQECDWETRVLEKSSISLGDEIEIKPLVGARQRIELKRTSMDFISQGMNANSNRPTKILPTMKNHSFHLRLLQRDMMDARGVKIQRFFLESLGGPFWHNGSLIFSLLLTDGDEIEVSYNKIRFNKVRPQIQDVGLDLSLHKRVVTSKLPILIEGETGSGKSSLAKKIHQQSGREGAFVQLNLSAFSPTLLESELFGHTKGAFTGAMNDKKGAIQRAQSGTLFLDEIDSIDRSIQVKLLLFLDSYRVSPVGSVVEQKVDCRLILASGRKLIQLVRNGEMRQDFYHRISSGHKFELPSLKQQPHLIAQFCQAFALKNRVVIEEKLIQFYLQLSWPGNYRQLEGHLQRKLVLSPGSKLVYDEVDQELLGDQFPISTGFDQQLRPLEEVKQRYCLNAYYQCQKHLTVTAQRLNISTKSLRGILQKAGAR